MCQISATDYSVYHLHELEAALKALDELVNPDEAKLIRELIGKGGYKYPFGSANPDDAKSGQAPEAHGGHKYVGSSAIMPPIEEISFTSVVYKATLVVILSGLLLLNVLGWFSERNAFSLIPIAFQGTMLSMIYLNHKHTRILIKVWSSLLIISGVAGLLSMYFSGSSPVLSLIWHLTTFTVGLVFLLLANRCVRLVHAISDLPRNQDELLVG